MQFPRSEVAVSATVEHDVQGDEVAISAMGMGIHRAVVGAGFKGDPSKRPPRHRKCFAHGQIRGYQREVRLCLSLSLALANLCLTKVHGVGFHAGYDPLLFVRQMPRVPPKSPHTIDRMRTHP